MQTKNIPELESAFCSKDEFDLAIRVILGSYQEGGVPVFETGFFGPGAVETVYGHGWFSLDYALMVDGAKWIDFAIAKDFNRNMMAVQKPDGRVLLDTYDSHKAGNGNVVGTDEVSSLPQIFKTAYQVSIMSGEEQLIRDTFKMLESALNWWFEKRQDPTTKLITAVTEETFIANHIAPPMVYAPMDTNEKVILGCENTALLAEMLDDHEKAKYLRSKKQEIIDAVETYLWNEEDGCYYPYLLSRKEQYPALLWHTFLGFSFTDESRKRKLTRLLLDDTLFNWNLCPVTSVSKKDKLFTATRSGFGPGYSSVDASWRGSIWMPSNIYVMDALERGNRKDLAADLALKTVNTFSNFRHGEFANPLTGVPEGLTMSYGWTAAGYFQILVEKLLGIDYTPDKGLTVQPNFPVDCPERYRYASLKGLMLPNGKKVDIIIRRNDVKVTESSGLT